MSGGNAMGVREWVLLLTLSVLWGGSFFFAEVALAELGPLTVVFARVALAAVALHAFALATGRRPPASAETCAAFAVMGLLNNALPFGLIVWGQTRLAGGQAAILNATTPLFTVVAAHFLTADERLTPGRVVGVLLGLAGVAVMIGPAAATSLAGDVTAQLAVLAAALSYALAGIYGRRFRSLPPVVVAAGQVTASTCLLLPVASWAERPWESAPPGPAVLAAVVALALLSTAAAYVIYFRLLATAGPTNLLLVTFLIPVSATGLGVAILGERIEPWHLAGLAGIAGGLAAIDGRPWRLVVARFTGEAP